MYPNPSIDTSICCLTDRSMDRPLSRFIDVSVDQPICKQTSSDSCFAVSTHRPAGRSMCVLIYLSADLPVDLSI